MVTVFDNFDSTFLFQQLQVGLLQHSPLVLGLLLGDVVVGMRDLLPRKIRGRDDDSYVRLHVCSLQGT
jgi:hypothetical protein